MNEFIIKLTIMTTPKITPLQLREVIGVQMRAFCNKLKEWAGDTNSVEIEDFNKDVCTLVESNLKLLCCIVGKCFGDESTVLRIKARDETLWTDKEYITKLKASLKVTNKDFDLSAIFGNFAQKDGKIDESIQNDFWARLTMICSLYQKLAAVDDSIYEDVNGKKRA
jgi:hypothetical protein